MAAPAREVKFARGDGRPLTDQALDTAGALDRLDDVHGSLDGTVEDLARVVVAGVAHGGADVHHAAAAGHGVVVAARDGQVGLEDLHNARLGAARHRQGGIADRRELGEVVGLGRVGGVAHARVLQRRPHARAGQVQQGAGAQQARKQLRGRTARTDAKGGLVPDSPLCSRAERRRTRPKNQCSQRLR